MDCLKDFPDALTDFLANRYLRASDGHCLVVSKMQSNFSNCNAICSGINGTLASLDLETDTKGLFSAFMDYPGATTVEPWWTGLYLDEFDSWR